MSLFLQQSLMTILITTTSSEFISCGNGECGPCSNDAPLCNLNCYGQSCSSFQCPSNIPCSIFCDTNYDPSSTACQQAIFYGQSSSLLNIYCNSEESCIDTKIHCPMNGDCNIDCSSNAINDTNTCSNLELICGTGSCQIDCTGGDKCNNIKVNTSLATSFLCIGSYYDCYAAPAPFTANDKIIIQTQDNNNLIFDLMTDIVLIGLLAVLIGLCLCFLYYMKRKHKAERKKQIEDLITKQS